MTAPPRRHPDRQRRRGPARTRCVAALLSVLVLTTTGYAWATLHGLATGEDVINGDSGAADGAIDILLVGNDSRTDAQGNPLPDDVLRSLHTGDDGGSTNTDTMILVRIVGQRVEAVSLPRDTLVRFADGSGMHKLNGALGTGISEERQRLVNEGVTNPAELAVRSHAAGQRLLINTVEGLTGAHIDHYAEVNLLGFYQLTTALGGVDVCLRQPVDDPFSGARFRAGPQTIQGGAALAFVRQRHGLPRGDLDRVVRQQVFLSGLAREILSTGTLSNPLKLSDLVATMRRSLTLDKNWDVLTFAQQMQGITGGHIEFHTIPVRLEGPSGRENVVADVPRVHRFIADLELDPRARREQTTVNVHNTTAITGLARTVLGYLADQGFTPGLSDNAAPQESSVRSAPGDMAAAKQISRALGGLVLRPDASVPPGTVEVYLGVDYRGPGAGSAPVQPAAWVRPLPHAPQQRKTGDPPITADDVPCVN